MATPWYAWNHGLDDERFPAHPEPTCAYNSTCQDAPDPGSVDGLCTYHRANAEPYGYDDREEC